MREAIQAWLDAQCSDLQGVSDAVIMLVPRGGQVRLAAAATWPRGAKASDELRAAALNAFDSQVPAVTPLAQPGQRRRSVVAHPVQVGNRTVGAVAIAMRTQARSGMQSVLGAVERGAVSFENFLRQWRAAHAPPPPGDAFFKTGAFTSAKASTDAGKRSTTPDLPGTPSKRNRRVRAAALRTGAVSRIGLGSISLVILLIFSAGLLISLLAEENAITRQLGRRTDESLPVQIAALVQAEEYKVGVVLALVLCVAASGMFYLYLRHVLRSLAPSEVIPRHLHSAFDALAEGVLVIDRQGNVVLANRAFRQVHPLANAEMTGKRIEDIDWLAGVESADAARTPWARAMEKGESVTGAFLQIAGASGEKVKVAINCSPIQEGQDQVRGCLITFDDLSTFEHMNRALLDLVSRLDAANDKIQQHNEELKHLANHDQMTGALTRRAFMQQAEQIFLRSVGQRGSVSCVMVDIDRFKSINDRYGHLVGDLAIRHVADVLKHCVRAGDLVCRFGGEEFCVLLPRATEHDAMEVAERMRANIESTAGSAVVPGDHVRITSSFGVSSIAGGSVTLSELIRQADQALYAAKAMGRNLVMHGAGTGATSHRQAV